MGPYTVKSVSKSGLCALVNEKGVQLKKKYNASLLKLYYSNDDLPPVSEPPANPIHQDDIISHPPTIISTNQRVNTKRPRRAILINYLMKLSR